MTWECRDPDRQMVSHESKSERESGEAAAENVLYNFGFQFCFMENLINLELEVEVEET